MIITFPALGNEGKKTRGDQFSASGWTQTRRCLQNLITLYLKITCAPFLPLKLVCFWVAFTLYICDKIVHKNE